MLFISILNTQDSISCSLLYPVDNMCRVVRKQVFGVFDQVRHKPGWTATEDDERLEITDLGSKGIVLSV